MGALSRPGSGLERCLACGRDFVSVVRSSRAGTDSWWLLLRCGGCGTWHETFARQRTVDAMQQAIAIALEQVAEGIRSFDLQRMGREVDAFAHALELDLIGADDF
jgi:hypothetical protein